MLNVVRNTSISLLKLAAIYHVAYFGGYLYTKARMRAENNNS